MPSSNNNPPIIVIKTTPIKHPLLIVIKPIKILAISLLPKFDKEE
jgi:hypothetical protein